MRRGSYVGGFAGSHGALVRVRLLGRAESWEGKRAHSAHFCTACLSSSLDYRPPDMVTLPSVVATGWDGFDARTVGSGSAWLRPSRFSVARSCFGRGLVGGWMSGLVCRCKCRCRSLCLCLCVYVHACASAGAYVRVQRRVLARVACLTAAGRLRHVLFVRQLLYRYGDGIEPACGAGVADPRYVVTRRQRQRRVSAR